MSVPRKELTFEGGVNLNADPHLLASNEWQKLQNVWPYSNKILGTRPSLTYEQDLLPVPISAWNGNLDNNPGGLLPTNVRYYSQWFRHLTPLKTIFLGSLDKVAMICVCNNGGKVNINEQFEGEAAKQLILEAGEVILMVLPCDIQSGPNKLINDMPMITAVRLGRYGNITPSLIEFNGDILAANKDCEYVVRVVKKDSIVLPAIASATVWPVEYRFTKINFGDTNLDFRADGVAVYKNRFVYWEGNKAWFSDPFQPEVIYPYARQNAYLGLFFDLQTTEDITAMCDLFTTTLETAGTSNLAIWTQHSMIIMSGEPATTIASTAAELFTQCQVTRVPITSGCVSAASIVKTKYGILWCGAESVWFMPKGNVPLEVGKKIIPRISDQSFESAGRIFATFEDLSYRLVINSPGVGFNPYEALNEMWCLTFANGPPSMESASWFGPQVFTNVDNPKIGDLPEWGGTPGLFCCAKLTTVNDDKTWYIQPYTYTLGIDGTPDPDTWGTRLGLCGISDYYGIDVTAPFRPVAVEQAGYSYDEGAIFHGALGLPGTEVPYTIEYVVTTAGVVGALVSVALHVRYGVSLYAKRPMYWFLDLVGVPTKVHRITLQSGNLIFDNPELYKLVDGYEITFKTLNPICVSSWWWPWQQIGTPTNESVLESAARIPNPEQNVLDAAFNEPVLTSRRVPPPPNKRYNGLTAQLNMTESDYNIIVTNKRITTPHWNQIRISISPINNPNWKIFDLFDYDINGIAKLVNAQAILTSLTDKCAALFPGYVLTPIISITGIGFRADKVGGGINPELRIDLTYPGWEWFGFVPTGYDQGFGPGYGVNILANYLTTTQYLYPTGAAALHTPHDIHIAKLAVRYRLLTQRPR